ncbi:hypothetical protein DRQ09_00610 [candidate division KSB1 bacterium]|nr:MAG: hypothetical protein DRQ09_00610 [candidate division KSB1 bacterium]
MWFYLFNDSPWWVYLIKGLFFVVAGLLIFVFPRILVAMVSAFLFFIGGLIITGALYVRKLKKESVRIRIF